MSAPEDRTDGTTESGLHIYRGDENELDEPENATDGVGRNSSFQRQDADVEAFWAGRNSANRHSARVAA
jgi:hypothetical protein